MFFKIVILGLVWGLNINLSYAQYDRPGWFVADDVADVTEDNSERNHPVVDEKISSKQLRALSSSHNPPKHDLGRKSNQYTKLLGNGFSLGKRELKLAVLLLKEEYKENTGRNFVISPLSFYAVSVLLANGVVDSTLLEFSKLFSVFRLADVSDTLKAYLSDKSKSYGWNISLWGNIFSQRYRTLIGDIVKAETWSLQGNTSTLNMWISEKTEGGVNKIIDERPVNDEELFVVSTVSFYHKWKFPFEQNLTKRKIFYAVDGEKTAVNMMYQNGTFDYFENDFMQVVRLFFDTGDFIVFYLPRENSDFNKFVANFDDYKMLPEFQNKKIDLFIPRFQLSSNVRNVREKFAVLGVKEIFSSIYNFAKMVNFDISVKVSEVFMNVRVRIDEGGHQGNESNVVVENEVNDNVSIIFNADRPFIFMINQGDIIGAVVKGNKLTSVDLAASQKEQVGEVTVKERKNGDPAWYENKNQQGDFILKENLKTKALSGQEAPDCIPKTTR